MPVITSQLKTPCLTQTNINSTHYTSPGNISSKIKKVDNADLPLQKTKADKIKSFILKKVLRIKNEKTEAHSLIGFTIAPRVANNFMGKLNFDSTGKIISIENDKLSTKDYNLLLQNRVKPLNEKPQPTGEKVRTPGEVLINIAGAVIDSDLHKFEKISINGLIKNTWLDGNLSRQSLINATELIKLKAGNNPYLIKKIDDIVATLEKDFHVTKRNDNYYGRLFETKLSNNLINKPATEMLQARDLTSKFILDSFAKESDAEKIEICERIADMMLADPPSWRHNIDLANKFLKEATPRNFIAMMKSQQEYSVPLVLSTAVKYIVTAPGLCKLKNQASQYYMNCIRKQRQFIESFNAEKDKKNDAYGLLLPYQKAPLSENKAEGIGIRPIDRYQRPVAGHDLTEHDAIALASERAVGIGMSGSANILHYLFKEIQMQEPSFPMEDAKLATASWLSYSGGHSFNEAYSAFSFMSSGNFKPFSFNMLADFSAHNREAISSAWKEVVDTASALNR